MALDTHELQQKRGELANKIREYSDRYNDGEPGWKDSAEKEAYEAVNAEYDDILAQIDRAQEAANLEARLSQVESYNEPSLQELANCGPDIRPAGPGARHQNRRSDHSRTQAFNAWFKAQSGADVSDSEIASAAACGISLKRNYIDLQLLGTSDFKSLQSHFAATPENGRHTFYNAPLTTTTGSTGGNMVPPETMLRQMEVSMLAFGGMLQVSDIITTSSGETLSWPTVNDTGNSGRLVAESTAADDNAGQGSAGDGGPNPTFAKTSWEAYKYTSDTVLVPQELIEDAVVDTPGLIGRLLGERLGRILNSQFTTGTGSSQPSGVVTGSALGVTAAGTTAITSDEVYDLQHSVDPAYRPNASFMMHDSVALYLRKLKDSQNRYLWQSGFNTGIPDTLAGARTTINQDMSSTITATDKTMLYGDFSYYKIRRVNNVRFYRLQEHYRNKDQDGFVAFLRADGGILDPGTDPIKHLIQAAA
jgi:HK97 family phage major capsid protein